MADTTPLPLTQGHINGLKQVCVHARLLHQYLQSPIQFLKWFRIKSAALGFVCDRDYEPSFAPMEEGMLPLGQNFLLTVQAATVLAAAEDSDKGQELCRYLMVALSHEHNPPVERLNVHKVQTITTAQAKTLKQLANERVSATRLPYQTVWSELKNRFGIRSYLDLCAEEFESACDFLSRPPEFLPQMQLSPMGAEEEIVFPEGAREVIESYSFDLSIDSIPLLRMILRNYISQYADPELLEDSHYVHDLLSRRFRDIEDCLVWANRRS